MSQTEYYCLRNNRILPFWRSILPPAGVGPLTPFHPALDDEGDRDLPRVAVAPARRRDARVARIALSWASRDGWPSGLRQRS